VSKNPYCSERCVLLISPDEVDHIALRRIVDRPKWTLLLARDLAEAERILVEVPVAAVLADSRCWKTLLPQMWTMGFPLIVADRLADERLWAEVLNLGAYDLVSKPFQAKEVLHVLSMACRRERSSLVYLSLKVHGCAEGQPVAEPNMEHTALAHP
jgi:DNA-binding response OmpR family regulator